MQLTCVIRFMQEVNSIVKTKNPSLLLQVRIDHQVH
jgi:hypothetical protein